MSKTWRNYIRSLLFLSNAICYNRLDLVHATATWLTKAADIHSQYATRIPSLRQQWLRERASMSRLYVHCPSCLYYAVYVSKFYFLHGALCYNYATYTNEMYNFQISALIRF